jgi:predicted nicotinamide N-methyase
MKIADFAAELVRFTFDGDDVALWRVADLERHVDRAALLGGDEPPEPPYWAHLWSGALVLARPCRADRGACSSSAAVSVFPASSPPAAARA